MNAAEYAESTWTSPTPWQPYPERWTSENSEAAEAEVGDFLASLVDLIKPEYFFESGTARGFTLERVCRGSRWIKSGACVVESYETDKALHEDAKVRLSTVKGVIDLYNCAALAGIHAHHQAKIGVAFLDSSLDSRPLELAAIRAKLEPGGVVVVHDVAPHHPTWLSLPLRGWERIRVRTPRGLALLQPTGWESEL